MNEQRRTHFSDEESLPDLDEGILPGVDLDLGAESDISGGNDLAELDEENLYGNDVLIGDTEEDEDA